MPFCLHLPREVHESIIAQAKSEQPFECCGLLAGVIVPADPTGAACPIAKVLGRYPLINTARSPVLFESDPRSMFEATRDIDRREWQILAVYHSHPTSPPIPSRTDLERNYDPEVMTMIVSLAGGEPLLRAWWLTADQFQEGDWELIG
jgi:[CysO sulfur-carrier protein]-S-L-cysteine hydrolase